MKKDKPVDLRERVEQAASAELKASGFVGPLGVMLRMGWLTGSHFMSWQKGIIPSLMEAVQVNPERQAKASSASKRAKLCGIKSMKFWTAGKKIEHTKLANAAAEHSNLCRKFSDRRLEIYDVAADDAILYINSQAALALFPASERQFNLG
jgi:hypothetical protein